MSGLEKTRWQDFIRHSPRPPSACYWLLCPGVILGWAKVLPNGSLTPKGRQAGAVGLPQQSGRGRQWNRKAIVTNKVHDGWMARQKKPGVSINWAHGLWASALVNHYVCGKARAILLRRPSDLRSRQNRRQPFPRARRLGAVRHGVLAWAWRAYVGFRRSRTTPHLARSRRHAIVLWIASGWDLREQT